MRKEKIEHTIEIIFPLLLVLMFCMCVILVIISGADIYNKTAKGMKENFTIRTAVPYLQEKFRECPSSDQIELTEEDGRQVLVFYQEVNDNRYGTYIYMKEGYLCELFTRASEQPDYQRGQELLAISAFHVIKKKDHLWEITVSDGKQLQSFSIYK